MKKLFVLAMMATLLMAGSAFAVERHFGVTPNATFTPGVGGAGQGPTTTNNDDTCDISVAPAATLLLPVFEVDTTRAGGENTLLSVTNVSRWPQIAHVVVWSEYSIPVLDFNLFLTGYDSQSLNMYDIIVTGFVNNGATTATTPGSLSAANTGNGYLSTGNCTASLLPGNLPQSLQQAVLSGLTTGAYNSDCTNVGGNHPGIARGYVTIDVANNCSTSLPTNSGYFTSEILFDNVLIGDYQQLGNAPVGGTATGFNGAGAPMVHIRAVPEGGPASATGTLVTTNLPFTFYDRYTPAGNRQADRRQPLPSTFAARYIQSAASGFATNYRIWREGTGNGTCGTTNGSSLRVAEIVRFDEAENPFTAAGSQICSPCSSAPVTLPEASITNTASSTFPTLTGSAVAGWMYLNLNNGGSATYSVNPLFGAPTGGLTTGAAITTTTRPSQNWVTVEMFGTVGTQRLSADFDAAWLGNGCSRAAVAAGTGANSTIGPAGSNPGLVCPTGITCAGPTTGGTNTTPLP